MPASSPLNQFLKWEKEIPNEIFYDNHSTISGKHELGNSRYRMQKNCTGFTINWFTLSSHVAILSKIVLTG
jgi:hypothetical protein